MEKKTDHLYYHRMRLDRMRGAFNRLLRSYCRFFVFHRRHKREERSHGAPFNVQFADAFVYVVGKRQGLYVFLCLFSAPKENSRALRIDYFHRAGRVPSETQISASLLYL